MINKLLLITFLFTRTSLTGQSITHPTNNQAFLQNEIAEIHISINTTDLNILLGDSLYTDHHFPATFYYHSSALSDTIQNVGFRVRGNTSRGAYKKSFKVSFNEYTQGKKFKGIEKMNLV